MHTTTTPAAVLSAMLQKDHYSKWLGIIIDEHREGYCRLHFTVRQEMLNGFGIAHGGIIFSVADSAFAFACNARGRLTVALDVTISFIRQAVVGDVVHVEAKELHCGHRTGFYDVVVTNHQQELIAVFKGTAYSTGKMVCEDEAAK